MRLQTDRRIELVRLVKTGDGAYAEAKDPHDPSLNAPAWDLGREFAPEIPASPGDLFLMRVLE
jgi:hypothetical protein